MTTDLASLLCPASARPGAVAGISCGGPTTVPATAFHAALASQFRSLSAPDAVPTPLLPATTEPLGEPAFSGASPILPARLLRPAALTTLATIAATAPLPMPGTSAIDGKLPPAGKILPGNPPATSRPKIYPQLASDDVDDSVAPDSTRITGATTVPAAQPLWALEIATVPTVAPPAATSQPSPAAAPAATAPPSPGATITNMMVAALPVAAIPTPPTPIASSPVTDPAVLPAPVENPGNAGVIGPFAALVPAIFVQVAVSTTTRLARQAGAPRTAETDMPARTTGDGSGALSATTGILSAVSPIPTPGAPATPATPPRDFAALVDRLVEARAAAQGTTAPQQIRTAVHHAEFGRVSLTFQQDSAGLSVSMSSIDPGFARAAQSALIAGSAPAAADLTGGTNDPSGGFSQGFVRQDTPGITGAGVPGQTPAGLSFAHGGSGQSQPQTPVPPRPQAIAGSNNPTPAQASIGTEAAAAARQGIFA